MVLDHGELIYLDTHKVNTLKVRLNKLWPKNIAELTE